MLERDDSSLVDLGLPTSFDVLVLIVTFSETAKSRHRNRRFWVTIRQLLEILSIH